MPLPWRGERERPYYWVRQCQEKVSAVPPADGQSVERNGHHCVGPYAPDANAFKKCRRSVMKIDGGCHCGYITYEAEADPEAAIICNCTDCQTLSGSAFRTVLPTRLGSFKLRSGALKTYATMHDSGTAR